MTRYVRALRAPLLLFLTLWAVVPAEACGCGAYIPREGDAHVEQERAVVRWDGTTEDIVMALSVTGRSSEAAWILPVPAAATVALDDARLFEALQELTKPEVRVEHRSLEDATTGGAAPDARPVTLLERQELGPFDVSTLAATDADALGNWLQTNGYQFPQRLAEALQPYVEQQWLYVAVRLTPEAANAELTGDLDPIRVTFATDRIIYPMRLSALAQNALPVFLYVLADHRVDLANVEQAGATPRIQYAGWVDPTSLPTESPIAPLVPRRMFLTKFHAQIFDPASIKDDWVFAFAPSDELHRDVEIRYVYDEPMLERALWPGATIVLLGVLLVLGFLFARRVRAR